MTEKVRQHGGSGNEGNSLRELLGEELEPYLHQYLVHKGRVKIEKIPEDSPSHPHRMYENGLNILSIRRDCGLSREDVASALGVGTVVLQAFEGGLIPPAELPEGFAQNLSMFLKGAVAVRRKIEGQGTNPQV